MNRCNNDITNGIKLIYGFCSFVDIVGIQDVKNFSIIIAFKEAFDSYIANHTF